MKAPLFIILVSLTLPILAQAETPVDRINARCKHEWGDNYRMQKYCRTRQMDAMRWMASWHGEYIKDKPETYRTRIFGRCASEWKDNFGFNWPMVKYCVTRQEEAYKQLSYEGEDVTVLGGCNYAYECWPSGERRKVCRDSCGQAC